MAAEGRNRRALGDIGNLVPARGGVDVAKPLPQVNRPITRSPPFLNPLVYRLTLSLFIIRLGESLYLCLCVSVMIANLLYVSGCLLLILVLFIVIEVSVLNCWPMHRLQQPKTIRCESSSR